MRAGLGNVQKWSPLQAVWAAGESAHTGKKAAVLGTKENLLRKGLTRKSGWDDRQSRQEVKCPYTFLNKHQSNNRWENG